MVDDPRLRRHPLGFLQVADLPTPEELRSYYEERYFQQERGNYRKSYPEEERAYLEIKLAQRAHQVFELRGGDTPGSFLDVGCGEGFALAWFEERGWKVEGLDHSSAGLEAMNPGLVDRVTCGDLFALLGERVAGGASYDLVWLSNVLEHVREPVELLESLRRVIAPGGVLVVTVPNDGSALQESLLERGDIEERFWIAIPDHLSYFDHDSLQRTAEATGWACRQILTDFPIDLFLLHPGSNYVRDRSQGKAAHMARVRTELLLGERGHQVVNQLYAAMARAGLGRQLTAFLTPGEPR
jgi:SAM-dependent methyltransferase